MAKPRDDPVVEIVITLNEWEPPEGKICLRVESSEDDLLASSFQGWLGLVARLNELLGRMEQPMAGRGRPG